MNGSHPPPDIPDDRNETPGRSAIEPAPIPGPRQPPQDEPEVIDAEIVDDLPRDAPVMDTGPALPKRRPDAPRDAALRRPILTALLNRDWSFIRAHLAWRARTTRAAAPYFLADTLSALFSPIRAARGARRIVRGLVRWHSGAEYTELAGLVDNPDKAYAVTMTRDIKRTERALFWASPFGCGLLLMGMLPVNVLYWWARFGTLPVVLKQTGAVLLVGTYVTCALAGRNRALATAVEMARDVVIDTAAIVEACKAAKLGEVRVLGSVAHEKGLVGAAVATVELPPGGVAAKATRRCAEMASALGVDRPQVSIEPLRGQHAGGFSLWVADENPFGPEVRAPKGPLLTAERTNVWDPIPVAYTPRGYTLTIDMGGDFAGTLLGGGPGTGKSAAAVNLLGAVALDPYCELRIADGKGLDSRPLWPIATQVTTADPAGLAVMLEDLKAELDRRSDLIGEAGAKKLTRDLARTLRLRMIVAWVDELAFFTMSKGARDAINEPMRDLVARCRAVGIRILAATQKPDGQVIPTALRDLISGRWALRCETPEMSDTVLGRGKASAGFDASLIEAGKANGGIGYLKDEIGQPTYCRSFFYDDAAFDRIAERAYALREKAGTLPVRNWPPALLVDMATAFADQPKIHTVDLLAALNRAGHNLADADTLAAALRPYGLSPADQWINGSTRKGYRLADVRQVIDAGPPRP